MPIHGREHDEPLLLSCHDSVIEIQASGHDFTTYETHGYEACQRAEPHLPGQLASHGSSTALSLFAVRFVTSDLEEHLKFEKGFRTDTSNI